MPVRIYDIAKKLGIESKEVLSRAKELGIAAARVPSSSLDKITAEYLESHLKPAAPTAVETPPAPPPAPEPILIVSAPPPETPAPAEPSAETPEPPAIEIISAPAEPVAEPAQEEVAEAKEPPAPVEPPAPPPVPAGPRIGELVGRIQLPSKPAPRTSDKPGLSRPAPRGTTPTSAPGRPDFGRGRFDQRGQRGPQQPYGRSPQQGSRPSGSQSQGPARPAAPSGPSYVGSVPECQTAATFRFGRPNLHHLNQTIPSHDQPGRLQVMARTNSPADQLKKKPTAVGFFLTLSCALP
jgi:translation initiation factor IF-2